MKTPKKHTIESWLDTIAFSFPKVYPVMLQVGPAMGEYTARVCLEGHDGPLRVTDKQWNYHELLLAVEQQLEKLHND